MNKIKLAVVFDQIIYSGGAYQQSINALLAAKKLPKNLVEVIFYTTKKENIKTLEELEITARLVKLSFFSKVRVMIYRKIKDRYLFKFARSIEKYNPREKCFIKDKIDLIYFLSPTSWPIDLEKTNFITTVWDLCHRDHPEFPEVKINREFERRENNYKLILTKATAIITDCIQNLENITKRYNVDKNRIHIIPFQSGYETRISTNNLSSYEFNIKKKYNLNQSYIFYPAQFWSHKNHVYLLKGIKLLEEKHGIKIGAIFSGKDRGNLNHVKECVNNLKLSERIKFIGFVSNLEMVEIYRQSIALVMPTYFGPTNIPPLEAFEIGTPVICSNIDGSKDQFGDAVLYIDLKDPSSMVYQLKKLLDEDNLRMRLINEGKKKAKLNNAIQRHDVLKFIIEEFKHKKSSWS